MPDVSVTHGVGCDKVAEWCKSIEPKWVEATDQWPHAGDIGEALRKYNSSAVHDKKLRKVVELYEPDVAEAQIRKMVQGKDPLEHEWSKEFEAARVGTRAGDKAVLYARNHGWAPVEVYENKETAALVRPLSGKPKWVDLEVLRPYDPALIADVRKAKHVEKQLSLRKKRRVKHRASNVRSPGDHKRRSRHPRYEEPASVASKQKRGSKNNDHARNNTSRHTSVNTVVGRIPWGPKFEDARPGIFPGGRAITKDGRAVEVLFQRNDWQVCVRFPETNEKGVMEYTALCPYVDPPNIGDPKVPEIGPTEVNHPDDEIRDMEDLPTIPEETQDVNKRALVPEELNTRITELIQEPIMNQPERWQHPPDKTHKNSTFLSNWE